MLSTFYCLLSVPTVFYTFCSQACSQIGRSKRIRGSTIPPRSLRHSQARSSVHGAVLFPRFYLAQFCKVPPAAFYAHRFRISLSKDNKHNLSLSVTRSLVAHPPVGPCSLSVRECSSLPRSSVRQIIFVPKKSIVTGSFTRKPAYLTHTVGSGRKPVRRASLRSSPPLGPSALRPSWPRAPGPSFRAFPLSVQGQQNCVFMAPLFKAVCSFASRHLSGIPSARNLSSIRVQFPFFAQVSACRTWL